MNEDTTEFIADGFRMSLTWDEEIRAFEGEERGDGYAAVRLTPELLTTAIVSYVSGDGRVTTCLDNSVAILNERGAGMATVVVRPDGQQDVTVSGDGTRLQAYVVCTDRDVPSISRIVCYSLGATDVLAIEFTGPASEIRRPEATGQIGELLAGLRFWRPARRAIARGRGAGRYALVWRERMTRETATNGCRVAIPIRSSTRQETARWVPGWGNG